MIVIGTALLALLSTVSASAILWYKFPGILVRWFFRFNLYASGLRIKFVKAGKYRYCYAERGQPQQDKLSLVLLHGFCASKDMWVEIVKKLPKDIHIIVLDLPGHGDTSIPAESDDIDVITMTHCVHDALTAIGISQKPFHLLGTSMGGAMAGLYAAFYPDKVDKLTMICPAMKAPVETEFVKEVRQGICRLLPETPEEMQIMLDSTLYHKVKIHRQFLAGALALREDKSEYTKRLFEALRSELDRDLLEENISKVKASTQLIWGRHDEIIHVSGAELLQRDLPNCQKVTIVEECAHSVNIDRPGTLTKLILQFHFDHNEELYQIPKKKV